MADRFDAQAHAGVVQGQGGAALLAQDASLAAIELCMFGGRFGAVGGPLRLALTGATMAAARIDGAGGRSPLAWCSSFTLEPGEILELGPTTNGFAGYLNVGGGIAESLRRQADDVWNRRRDLAIQRAQSLPTKLAVPLVFCFLPGIFVFTFGPAIAQFLEIADGVVNNP